MADAKNLYTWPDKIWLQHSEDGYPIPVYKVETDEITWEASQVFDCDVCYVRADLLDAAKAEIEHWKEVAHNLNRLTEVGEAVNRACLELPEGADLSIELERGAGTIRLYLPPAGDDESGEVQSEFDTDTFGGKINLAIDMAIEAASMSTKGAEG